MEGKHGKMMTPPNGVRPTTKGEYCPVHEELMEELHLLIGDLKWMIRIGKWVSGSMGALFLALLPMMVLFFVAQSNLQTRMAGYDASYLAITKLATDGVNALQKHTELPQHFGAGIEMKRIEGRIDTLCQQVGSIEKRVDRIDRIVQRTGNLSQEGMNGTSR